MADVAYSYSSEPQPAPTKRTRPRPRDDADSQNTPSNIMYDRRVVRGNTHAAKVMTASVQEAERLMRETEHNRRQERIRRKTQGTLRSSTPPPVSGRMHMTMQTDDYLEELTDRPIEVDSETQTHPLLNRPPSPLFVPAKIGCDKATQIADGDLFDFDLEVEPLLEVLVGKSIQMAVMELMEEEELEAIRRQQAKFEEQRNTELAEVQRLEAEARRKQIEKENRLRQEQARQAARQQLEEKIAARGFAKQYLTEMHNKVFDNLHDAGYFYDPVLKEVMREMLVTACCLIPLCSLAHCCCVSGRSKKRTCQTCSLQSTGSPATSRQLGQWQTN